MSNWNECSLASVIMSLTSQSMFSTCIIFCALSFCCSAQNQTSPAILSSLKSTASVTSSESESQVTSTRPQTTTAQTSNTTESTTTSTPTPTSSLAPTTTVSQWEPLSLFYVQYLSQNLIQQFNQTNLSKEGLDRFQQFLKVQPTTKINVKICDCSECKENVSAEFDVSVQPNSLHILIQSNTHEDCENKTQTAPFQARICHRDPVNNRPIIGRINICPTKVTSLTAVLLRRAVIQILGFGAIEGPPLTSPHLYPLAIAAAKQHFNCSSIESLKVELDGSWFWNKTIFQPEIMSSDWHSAKSISDVTLAALEDLQDDSNTMPLYQIDRSNAFIQSELQQYVYGKQGGCDFLEQNGQITTAASKTATTTPGPAPAQAPSRPRLRPWPFPIDRPPVESRAAPPYLWAHRGKASNTATAITTGHLDQAIAFLGLIFMIY